MSTINKLTITSLSSKSNPNLALNPKKSYRKREVVLFRTEGFYLLNLLGYNYTTNPPFDF